MEVSINGINLIKGFEGFSAVLYDDAGHKAIGYGCDLTEDEAQAYEGLTITEAQATRLLVDRLQDVQRAINGNVTVPLNQNQFDALCSFTYNVGVYAFAKSTMVKLLNESDYSGASDQFDKWVFSAGNVLPALVDRRAKEKELFLKENGNGEPQGPAGTDNVSSQQN